jgi:integrase
MRKNLTVAFVESAKCPERGRTTYWDTSLRTYGSFGLRVTDRRQKSWVISYRTKVTHDQRWMTLGSFPSMSLADARADARQKLARAADGGDPANEKQEARQQAREADSLDELAHRFLDECADVERKPGTAAEYRRLLERELIPQWGARRARDITRADVKQRIGEIRARIVAGGGDGVGANRVLVLISRIFNWAMEQDIPGVEANPAHKVKPINEKGRARERVLNLTEITKFWKALESEDEPDVTRDAYRVLMLTGQRPSEIREMRWSEIELPEKLGPQITCAWWTLPGGRLGRTKNWETHRIPFVGEALKIILSRWTIRGDNEFVFPGRDRKSPFASWQKVHGRVTDAVGFAFQPRDLRRTVATGLAKLHVERTVIRRILNHSEGDITAVYERHHFNDEKIEALSKWDRHVKELLAAADSPKVIPLVAKNS